VIIFKAINELNSSN